MSDASALSEKVKPDSPVLAAHRDSMHPTTGRTWANLHTGAAHQAQVRQIPDNRDGALEGAKTSVPKVMTSMKTTLKATLVATAIAMLPFGAQAAGLGAINVLSGLGQPLRAEIDVQATPEELRSLNARLAPPAAFSQANLGYPSVLSSLRFSVETRGNRSVIKVSSDQRVDEPFIEMLVEVEWIGGRLMRQYTFLLDPVELTRPPLAAAVITQPAQAARPASPGPVQTAAPRTAESMAGARYQVARGDTLHSIANRNRPAGTTVEQVMIAMLRQSPDAFADGNINRLRAGAILTIPDRTQVESLTAEAARREVVAHAGDFEAYRRGLAGTATRRDVPVPDSREQAGTITPRVAEAEAATATRDRVEVSAGGVDDRAESERVARLQALEEELVARERSLEEAYARLGDLEQNIRDLQALIEMRSESMARMQQLAEAAASSVPVDALAPPAEGDPVDDLDALPGLDELLADIEEPASVAPAAETPPAQAVPAQVASAPAPAPAPAAEPVQPMAERPSPETQAPAPDPFVDQPSFLQSLLRDPAMMAAGGGVLVLLLAYAAYRIRQRRKDEPVEEEQTQFSEMPSGDNSIFGQTGGQSVDTATSVLHTDFSQSGLGVIDADEGVDPVAEADVYMAYGRDAQAEEILLDAIKADPSRSAVYVKLLEIYVQRGDRKQFESVAADLYSRTGGSGEDWERAAELGRQIDPGNPLYKVSARTEAAFAQPMTTRVPSGVVAATAGIAAGAAGAAQAAKSDDMDSAMFDLSEPGFTAASNELSELDFTTSIPQASDSQLKDTWTMPDGDLSRVNDAIDRGSDDDIRNALVPEDEASDSDIDEDADFSVLDFDLSSDDASSDSGETTETLEQDVSPAASADDDLLKIEDAFGGATDVSGNAFREDIDEQPNAGKALNEPEFAPLGPQASKGEVDTSAMSAGDMDKTVLADEYLRQAIEGDTDGSSVVDLEKSGFDNSLLDFEFDFDSPETPTDLDGESDTVDLSAFDLDLATESPDLSANKLTDRAESGVPVSDGDSTAPAVIDDSDLPEAEVHQAVETKLDLARAYEEMGDREGARELIDEILAEGTPSQCEAARRLLDRLRG